MTSKLNDLRNRSETESLDRSTNLRRRELLQDGVVVILLIAICTLLVNPFGEYAILDDWAYVKSLEHLHVEGEEVILDWNPMSLLGLLYWALPFTKTFGFSFTVTKLSVIALFAVECLTLLWLMRLCGVPRNLAYAGLLALMFQPLHFVHCYMFMTDVPALTWKLVAVACYSQGLRQATHAHLWLGTGSLAAGFAFLIRQNGLLVPVAFGAYLVLFQRELLRPSYLLAAFLPVTLNIVGFQVWYRNLHGPTAAFEHAVTHLKTYLGAPPWTELPIISFSILMYLGFFLIPVAGLVSIRRFRLVEGAGRWIFLAVAWILIDACVYFAVFDNRIFPYLRNVITPFGFFEPTEYLIGGLMEVLWSRMTAFAVTVLSLAALIVLLNRVAGLLFNRGGRDGPVDDESRRVVRLLLLFLGAELGYLMCTAPLLFDRHLLPLAPVGILLVCASARHEKQLCWTAYAVCLIPMIFYSITATHDLHSISRLAFYAGNDLIKDDVDPRLINAGYAFDCWYTYEMRQDEFQTAPSGRWWKQPYWVRIPNPHDRYHWDDMDKIVNMRETMWWVGPTNPGHPIHYRYLVTTSLPFRGSDANSRFRVVKEYRFQRWWPWKTDSIYVLEDTAVTKMLDTGSRRSSNE